MQKFIPPAFYLIFVLNGIFAISSDNGECKPLRTNHELINFYRIPIAWSELVEPIRTRARVRRLGLDYENFVPSREIEDINRPKVLVCHDLAGNYRGDRFINGSSKYDDYRFYHWSGIDLFCYFSHEYVTIPPLSWINAAHKHGVKVLGTVIFENAAGQKILEEILRSKNTLKLVADALVLIAMRFKFEGWLLNVECKLNSTKIPLLRDFVEYLTLQMHKNILYGTVIWYDSIIESGKLRWQNELNNKNKLFFDVCDGILINYGWNGRNLIASKKIVNGMPEAMSKIFFGIDVFGRGQRAEFETATTLRRIMEHSFSVGIFAPAWTFEKCENFGVNIHSTRGIDVCNNMFIDRNNRFWAKLWKFFYTAGPNELPFYSTFCLGSGRNRYHYGTLVQPSVTWFNLAEQSLQPSVPVGMIQRSFDEAYNGGSSIKVLRTEKPKRLFVTDFDCSNDIIMSYAYKAVVVDEDLSILLAIVDDFSGRTCILECGNGNTKLNTKHIKCKLLKRQNRQKVLNWIGERNETIMPTDSNNGWQIRYFYLYFDDTVRARITDIGVHVRNGDGTYLGAIHVHEGMKPKYNFTYCNDISLISCKDFD